MNNILVVAAHPDDELIGCGATIAKHIKNNDKVSVLILSSGISSRHDIDSTNIEKDKNLLHMASKNVSKFLGYDLYFENFVDQEFDSYPLLQIIKKIEKIISQVNPDVVYTHCNKDLNLDHKITFEAVITACRPCNKNKVKEIYLFETVSSTEWKFNNFQPNYFVSVDNDISIKKIEALKYYVFEMRQLPHPRSVENIMRKLQVYGTVVLENYAEAFEVFRIIK